MVYCDYLYLCKYIAEVKVNDHIGELTAPAVDD